MAKRLSTGRNEVGMLSDLKEIAERIGSVILGFDVEWKVETSAHSIGKRPDVEIRRADGNRELIASGEAKRPETVKGLHVYVETEVTGALAKARALGGRYAFTTNFLDIALFDAQTYDGSDYLATVVSEPITLIDEKETSVQDWWSNLTRERLGSLVQQGLEDLFRQLRSLRTLNAPVATIGKDEAYFTIFKASTDAIINEALPEFLNCVSTLTLPPAVTLEAKERDFDFSKVDVVRYFVAQATAEALTSGLFYETVRPTFSLKSILKGSTPSTSEKMLEIFLSNLEEATNVTGDYETIFRLSAGAKFILGIESDSLRALWLALFSALDGVKFAEINSEIIGVIFERLISADRRQDMGQHYTQTRLARAMTRWGVQDPDERVVDFCAGGGTFLVEAYTRLREQKAHEQVLKQVFGNDLDSFAVQLSTVNLATRDVYKGHNFPAVSNRDALDIRSGEPAVDVTPLRGDPYRIDFPEKFEVVLGNPPYDEKAEDPAKYRSDLAAVAGEGGRSVLPGGLPDTINLAAWFILLAAAWLRPEGRIALVLPAAILQNEKHAPLLRWLRSGYDISVWHTESDVWFSDARVAPITLFMVPRAEKKTSPYGRFEFINVLEPVSGEVAASDELPRPVDHHVVRDLSNLPPEDDAIIAGTLPDTLREYEALPGVIRLKEIPGIAIYRGNKLGHAFYRLKDREPSKSSDRRSLLGFDIQTTLSKKYLTPLFRSPKDEVTGEFDPSKVDWWVLAAPATLPKGGELEKYIRAVKRTGANDAPSVKSKGKNWWSVSWKLARIAVGVHPQFQPQVWWSSSEFVATDNFQALTLPNTVAVLDQELLAASLASVYGNLSALYRSNEVGCEGVRWVSTNNVEGWFGLDWSKVSASDKAEVIRSYRAFRKATYAKVFEMTAASRTLWRDLNIAVARAAGAVDPERLADLAFTEADSTTLRRRKREIQATSGRTRSGATGSGKLLRDVKAFIEAHESFLKVVESLSEGEDTIILRAKTDEPEALFDIDNETKKIEVGNSLVELVGEGFKAAPVWEDITVESARQLYGAVVRQFVQVESSGQPMPGYEQVADTIREQVTKTLATAVKKRLT